MHAELNVEQARFNMIEQQIRPWNVLDHGVLDLLGAMHREEFVPAEHRALAFSDVEVPLPEGQCMLAPKIEARLLQSLAVQRHERVLEVGAGSGFMAALLAHKAQSVLSLECRPGLAKLAAANLARAGIVNATVREADGAQGVPSEAPFDAIVLSGSVARVPQALLDQLKPGGRLVAIEGEAPAMHAVRYTRGATGVTREELFETVAPRLTGFAEPSHFRF